MLCLQIRSSVKVTDGGRSFHPKQAVPSTSNWKSRLNPRPLISYLRTARPCAKTMLRCFVTPTINLKLSIASLLSSRYILEERIW